MDSETEGVDSYNEGVYKKFLTPEIKEYILRNPLNVNYIDKRVTRLSMGWNNLIVSSNKIHINPSHPPTLISKINMTTMALKLTLPLQTTKEWNMQLFLMMKTTMNTALIQTLTPPQIIFCKLK